MSINRGADKGNVVYIHNGIIVNHKEWNCGVCRKMMQLEISLLSELTSSQKRQVSHAVSDFNVHKIMSVYDMTVAMKLPKRWRRGLEEKGREGMWGGIDPKYILYLHERPYETQTHSQWMWGLLYKGGFRHETVKGNGGMSRWGFL